MLRQTQFQQESGGHAESEKGQPQFPNLQNQRAIQATSRCTSQMHVPSGRAVCFMIPQTAGLICKFDFSLLFFPSARNALYPIPHPLKSHTRPEALCSLKLLVWFNFPGILPLSAGQSDVRTVARDGPPSSLHAGASPWEDCGLFCVSLQDRACMLNNLPILAKLLVLVLFCFF